MFEYTTEGCKRANAFLDFLESLYHVNLTIESRERMDGYTLITIANQYARERGAEYKLFEEHHAG